ncbi:MAG: hypothetical protein HQL06_13040 [Nitrospirae bacterium]|nr:hypothetical protein [Nitrospirota bacterium]
MKTLWMVLALTMALVSTVYAGSTFNPNDPAYRQDQWQRETQQQWQQQQHERDQRIERSNRDMQEQLRRNTDEHQNKVFYGK